MTAIPKIRVFFDSHIWDSKEDSKYIKPSTEICFALNQAKAADMRIIRTPLLYAETYRVGTSEDLSAGRRHRNLVATAHEAFPSSFDETVPQIETDFFQKIRVIIRTNTKVQTRIRREFDPARITPGTGDHARLSQEFDPHNIPEGDLLKIFANPSVLSALYTADEDLLSNRGDRVVQALARTFVASNGKNPEAQFIVITRDNELKEELSAINPPGRDIVVSMSMSEFRRWMNERLKVWIEGRQAPHKQELERVQHSFNDPNFGADTPPGASIIDPYLAESKRLARLDLSVAAKPILDK